MKTIGLIAVGIAVTVVAGSLFAYGLAHWIFDGLRF